MGNKFKSIKSRSAYVGIVFLLSMGVLYVGMRFLGSMPSVFNTGKAFHAYYENIAGLTEGSSVTIKGYKIGTVTEINFDENDQLRVNFSVEDDIEIPLNSVAKIVSLDLMGTKGVNLILGDADSNASSGFELMSDIESSLQDEVNAQILPLKVKTEELIGSIDSVMTVITSVLNKDARESLTKSLVSLDKTFATLSTTMLSVNKIVSENKQNIITMNK